MATPENRVKDQIKKWLKDNHFYFFSAAAGPFSVHGVPDLVCCAQGTFVGIEVKAPGKEKNVTRNQQFHHRKIADNGGIAIIASSVDNVIEAFKSHDLI